MYKASDIQILHWHEAVRRRPEMYLGGKGPLSLRSMARRLFECPLDPRRLKVVIESPRLEIFAACVPISVEPRKPDEPIYLVEVAGRPNPPLDDPPSIAGTDVQLIPPNLRTRNAGPMIIAITNALSSEFKITSYRTGVATEARFSRGVLISRPATTPSPAFEDGLSIAITPDPEIFATHSFRFEDLAEELRDFALRRRVDVELLDVASNAVFAMHCWRKNENSALAGPSS